LGPSVFLEAELNMPSTEKSDIHKNLSLNIELGCKLFVQIEGIKERLSSNLIGLLPKRYLIVRTPMLTGIEYILKEGNKVVVRYVHLGEVYGFHSTVVRSITNPSKIIFLSYPQQIETINLRKVPRIGCFFPASLHHQKDEVKGIIKNLSVEGIKFTTKNIEGLPLEKLSIEDDVVLHFPLLGIDGIQEIHGKIKNMSQEQEELDFGIQFDKKDFKTITMIDDYIKQVKDYAEN
jgi:c-di-GMP-binding flagellar brake protein YcgR